jgi:hypothetical protein
MTGEFDTAAAAPAFAAVSNVLWSERETLEHLLYKLVAEQLVLTSGATRWLNHADAEVRAALDRLRASEVIRAAEVEALALAIGLPLETSLGELAEAAPEPWSTVLADHRTALRQLVFEIEGVGAENRRLLSAGAKAIRETLDHLGLAVAGYDATGSAVSTRRGPVLLDEQA